MIKGALHSLHGKKQRAVQNKAVKSGKNKVWQSYYVAGRGWGQRMKEKRMYYFLKHLKTMPSEESLLFQEVLFFGVR